MVLSLLIFFHFSDLLKVPKQFSLFSVVTVQHKLHADSMPSVALYIIANVSYKTLDRLDFTYFPLFSTQPKPTTCHFSIFRSYIFLSLCQCGLYAKMKTKNTHSFFSHSLLAKTAFCRIKFRNFLH